ncbi:MAG: deoxyribose-phosphate aldolase [Bryobacteraceae bacterium]|nr:deoxyribose-phosphate aldolase [Bryobacteraceae bacterium]
MSLVIPSPTPPPEPSTYQDLAALIDHHLLRPDLTDTQLHDGLQLARAFPIAAVVVRPCDLDFATRHLENSLTKVSAAVGFPHGTGTTASKLYELRDALRRGAQEIEFVLNLGKLFSREFSYVESELLQAAQACHEEGALCKVVLEASLLDDEMKIVAAKLTKRSSADFAVTATGFAQRGFSPRDLDLLVWKTTPLARVKAVHGINNLDQLLEARRHGVHRVGTTQTEAILQAWEHRLAAQRNTADPVLS